MTNNNFSQLAAFIWSVADLLRGDFKQSQYGHVILPFTLLRRLEFVLAPTKADVLAVNEKVKQMQLSEDALEKLLLEATNGLLFFNTAQLDLSRLNQHYIRDNLRYYIASFSKEVREIFDHFKFDEFIGLLDDANLLYKVVQYFLDPQIDFSPSKISNHEMGLVFEELIRRFAESSNETAGEYFTPRDILRLTTDLVFSKNAEALTKEGIIHTVYDPTAGTGGFLSAGAEYIREHNPEAVIRVCGQELNPESYAICKADMLIKGQDVRNIKLGNTLSNDQLAYEKFDYMLSNPPFGVDWKKIESDIKDEHEQKGFEGRFGPGLPRVSDGSLLFLMHLISKMRDKDDNGQGSRIGIILNGSPLFTGSAGSGESEIRRYIFEADLLEAIIALPTDMFYNTGIATYVWVLSNKKDAERKGKVHLINAANLSSKMRKSLGSKRNYLMDEEIRIITQNYSAFEAVDTLAQDGKSDQQKPFSSKIFNSYEFGYRRVTIERPLRLSAQMSDNAVASLRFAPKPFNAVMQKVYEQYGTTWTEDSYGQLNEFEAEIRALIKVKFSQLTEKNIKTVFQPKLWLEQRSLMRKAESLQAQIGTVQCDDFNAFDDVLKKALKDANVKLETKEKKQFLDAITWKNANAEPVINKVIKGVENPFYGKFKYQNKVVEFKQDNDLRDAENIPLDPNQATRDLIESYFKREVQPHVPDAWINVDKRDLQDNEIGIVGYEINFSNKISSKGKFDNKNLVRIKNIINTDKEGEFVLNRHSGELIIFNTVKDTSYYSTLTKFNIDNTILNHDYYNIFISLPEGKDWLDSSIPRNSTIRNITFDNWMNLKLNIPEMKKQLQIVDFFKKCYVILEKINLLKNSSLKTFEISQEQLKPYLETVQRYENEFSSMLPTPLAILWELAESRFNDRDKCEAYTKFYEFLGVYLTAILFGKHTPKADVFYDRRNASMKSLSMGFSHYQMNKLIQANPEYSQQEILSYFLNEEVIQLLKNTTSLRNDIAHRGLPSAFAASGTLDSLNLYNRKTQDILRDFFSKTTLVSPIQCKFDGKFFTYEVEVLKGLGINPCKTKKIKTLTPLISNKLYLITSNLESDENISIVELFPILILEESILQSEIKAFYFYSDSINDNDKKKLRYVCPYPNVETYKFLDWDIIKAKFSKNPS